MCQRIKLTRAVVVEGKYDKIKIASIARGTIIVTNGFEIYKDSRLCELIRFHARQSGLIVITDSDRAGRQIRAHIKNILPKELHSRVINIHIPQIEGKERRKKEPSKEGTLGVEGIDADVLRCLLKKACEADGEIPAEKRITKNDMYLLGLNGSEGAVKKRELLCKELSLPAGLSSSSLLDLLNSLYRREELEEICARLEVKSQG